MTGGNRHYVFAAACLIVSGAINPVRATPPYIPYPERDSDGCYTAKDHDVADLCAQWRAAIAAEKAADDARVATTTSIIGTVLSLATVLGLIITIHQTNGALNEARRGNRLNLIFERRSRREARQAAIEQAEALNIAARNAQAAEMLATLTKEMNQKSMRAYVNVEAITFLDPIGTNGRMAVRVTYVNDGNTPALEVDRHLRVLVAPDAEHDMPRLYPILGRSPRSISSMGKTALRSVDFIQNIGADIVEQLINGPVTIYAFGWIRYKDIFGDPHETAFEATYNSQFFKEGTGFHLSSKGNHST